MQIKVNSPEVLPQHAILSSPYRFHRATQSKENFLIILHWQCDASRELKKKKVFWKLPSWDFSPFFVTMLYPVPRPCEDDFTGGKRKSLTRCGCFYQNPFPIITSFTHNHVGAIKYYGFRNINYEYSSPTHSLLAACFVAAVEKTKSSEGKSRETSRPPPLARLVPFNMNLFNTLKPKTKQNIH